MSNNYGIRYIVIAAGGGPNEQPSEEDLRLVHDLIDSPFKKTILSGHVSDKLTLALLQERGAM